jgi:hypothetical protein
MNIRVVRSRRFRLPAALTRPGMLLASHTFKISRHEPRKWPSSLVFANASSRLDGTYFVSHLFFILTTVHSKHAKADTEPAIQNIVVDDIEVESATKEWENIIFSDEE